MNVNVNIEGYVENVVNNAIARGIVKTKAEAIRLGLLHLDKEYSLCEKVSKEEIIAVNKKIKEEMADIKKNKEKWYGLNELQKELGIENDNI